MSLDLVGEINWLATIVAALVYFVLGAIWFAPPLFGGAWAAAAGMQMPGEGAGPGAGIYAAPLIGTLLASIATAVIARGTGSTTLGDGVVLGIVLGIGFVASLMATTIAFETTKPNPTTWGVITAGYHFVGIVAVALIVSAWR